MSTEIAPLPGNLPPSPIPFGADMTPSAGVSGAHSLKRIISAFKRFSWLIILFTILGLAGGYLATTFMPESYVVSGAIMLEERGGNTGPVEAAGLLSGSQWLELLENPRVLDPVVRDLRLYIVGPNPTLGNSNREGPTGPAAGLFDEFEVAEEGSYTPGDYVISFSADGRDWELKNPSLGPVAKFEGAVGDSAGRRFGMQWVPRPRQWMYGGSFKFTLLTLREVSNSISEALGTKMAGRGSRFASVSYSGTDGERAKRTLNAILRQFISQAAQLKSANLVQNSFALDSQLVAAKQRMDEAQMALQNFQIKTATQPRDDIPAGTGLATPTGLAMATGSTYGQLFELRGRSDSLKRERAELAQALKRVQSGDNSVDQMLAIGVVHSAPNLLSVLNDILKVEGEIRAIEVTAGPENKALLDKQFELNELRTTSLPSFTTALLQRLDRDIASTETRINSVKKEMEDIPTRSITEKELAYNYMQAQNTHSMVQSRAELARLQSASSLPDVRILNLAVAPLRPSKNRKSVIMILGLMGGLGAGMGLAFLLDLLDKRFRYADQITTGLGLSILGVVPEIKRAKGKSASAEEAAQVVESFRTIRLNLSHAFPENGSISMTVTSPMPGDGKSLVSSNLALSFAEAGYRTLLIDGDTRRGELHRTFGTDRRPGLLDHLAGEIEMADTLRTTSHPKLSLMPAGSRHRNAPELMGSRGMHDLMAEMRGRYEVIIVDSPPLAAGIDPFVLGTITGNLMMVVRAGATERDLAEAKLQILDRLPVRLIGAVLNDVSSSMDEYKYYAYSYGYGTTEEDETLASLPATTVGTR